MFILNDDMSIYVTRGDVVFFTVSADDEYGSKYRFKPGEVVRIKVVEKKAHEKVAIQKDFVVTEETDGVGILLTEDETKIGKVISKPVDYWYEVELNPFTNPQTIVGYDDDGPKVFRLFPEGKDVMDDIPEEELPVVDDELSLTSTRPVQNQVVANAMANLSVNVSNNMKSVRDQVTEVEKRMGEVEHITGTDLIKKHLNASNPHNVTAEQVGARSNTWMPTADEVGARANTWMPTAEDVGARASTWMPTAEQVGARSNTWMPNAADVGAYGTHNITCGTSALTSGSSSLANNNIYQQYE